KFVAHGLGMRQGQLLVAKNSSPVDHNFSWVGHPDCTQGGNVLIPKGKEHSVADLKAHYLPVTITCGLHKWMNARVRVFGHPYFAVTDADGNFEIKLAPAGKWKLFVWQEEIGFRGGADGRKGMDITIKGDAVTDLGQ